MPPLNTLRRLRQARLSFETLLEVREGKKRGERHGVKGHRKETKESSQVI